MPKIPGEFPKGTSHPEQKGPLFIIARHRHGPPKKRGGVGFDGSAGGGSGGGGFGGDCGGGGACGGGH